MKSTRKRKRTKKGEIEKERNRKREKQKKKEKEEVLFGIHSQLVAVIVPWHVRMNVVVDGGAWSASCSIRVDKRPIPSQTDW